MVADDALNQVTMKDAEATPADGEPSEDLDGSVHQGGDLSFDE